MALRDVEDVQIRQKGLCREQGRLRLEKAVINSNARPTTIFLDGLIKTLFLSLGSAAYELSIYFQEGPAPRELLLDQLVECLLEHSVILQGLSVSLS
jgi:hypothetical protein